jgi:hypothetical protein
VTEDCRISTALASHPKTRKIERRLGAAGFSGLVKLLLWAASNRSNGDLSGLSDEDLELAAEWGGEPGSFVHSLAEVRFLDGATGSYLIHDWAEHNPWAAARGARVEAARKAAAIRWERRDEGLGVPVASAAPHALRMPAASEPHALRIHSAPESTAHHPTTPDQNQTKVKIASEAPSKGDGASPLDVLVKLPLKDGTEYSVTHSESREWQELYPAIDVAQQLRSMRGWCLANAEDRKARRGILRFITGWLQRQQNEAPVRIAAPAGQPPRAEARPAEWALPPGITLDEETGVELWNAALTVIERKLDNPVSFAWFRGTKGLGVDLERNCLYVRVPCCESLVVRDKYGETIREIFRELGGPHELEVEFIAPREVDVA